MKEGNLVPISECKRLILTAWKGQVEHGIFNRTLCFVGQQGIGKTDMIKQVGKELGVRVEILDLHAMEAPDLMGLQKENTKTGKAGFLAPSFLPIGDEECILVLDEVNRISQDMESPLYGMLINRKIGDHQLSDKCLLIAACNPSDSDGGTQYNVNDFDAALEGRFRPFGVNGTAEEFNNYMYEKHGSNIVTEFTLSDPGVVSFSGKRGTPRDFESLHNTLKTEALVVSLPMEELPHQIVRVNANADIGIDLASHFTSFLSTRKYCTPDMILYGDWEDCSRGLEKAAQERKFELKPALMFSIADRYLRDEDRKPKLETIIHFMEALGSELSYSMLQIMLNKEAKTNDPKINQKIIKLIKRAKELKSPVIDWAKDMRDV